MSNPDTSSSCCGCAAAQALNEPRRRVIRIAAAGLAAPLTLGAWPAMANTTAPGVVVGDRLVDDDAEGTPVPLRAADIKPGKPLLAYPFDAARGVRRDGTRLNKVVLMRLPEADMTPETRARAAGGVLAYSAICTHQGCDVKTWLAKERALVCFCHASKFALLDGAAVLNGPATRALPALPLALEGEQLVVAGAFTRRPGMSPA